MTFAFLALLGTVQDPDLRPLFERLAADDIEVREDAGRRIVALGRKAEPELRSLIRDPSRAAEARGLLFRALAGNDFASRLLKHLPDLDEHDAWEDDRTWLRLFQKVREGGEALRALRLREFERVFPELLRAGRAEDLLHTVLGEVTHAQMLGAVPHLIALLEDPDAAVREPVVSVLGFLGAAEAIPALLKAAPKEDGGRVFETLMRMRSPEAVGPLAECLRSPEAQTRQYALRALGELRFPGAAPHVATALRHPDAFVRACALEALGTLEAVDRLPDVLALFEDPDTGVRAAAAHTAARLGSDWGLPYARQLLAERESGVRAAGVELLGGIRTPEAAREIVARIGDKDWLVSRRAIEAARAAGLREAAPKVIAELGRDDVTRSAIDFLVEFKVRDAAPALEALLKDPSDAPFAIEALGLLGRPESGPAIVAYASGPVAYDRDGSALALARLRSKESVPSLLALLDHRQDIVRRWAAHTLGLLGRPEAAPEMANRLKSAGALELDLAEALARLGRSEGVDALTGALGTGPKDDRAEAAAALARAGARTAVPHLLQALKDEDGHVRYCALSALVDLRAAEAVPALAGLLQDPWEATSSRAAQAAVALGTRTVSAELRELLRGGRPIPKGDAARALGRLGDPSASKDLVELLETADDSFRVTLLDALGDLGDPATVPIVREGLDHPSGEVRQAAAAALYALAPQEVPKTLPALLRDEDSGVRRTAAEALSDLGVREAIPGIRRLLAVGDDVRPALWRLEIREGLHEVFSETGVRPPSAFALNALRRPDDWAHLREKFFVRRAGESVGQALRRMADSAGLRLEWEQPQPEGRLDPDPWAAEAEVEGTILSRGPRVRSTLARAIEAGVSQLGCEAVIEGGRLRLLAPAAADSFWKEWIRQTRGSRP